MSDILADPDDPQAPKERTITLLMDSGTSTLAVARRLKDLLDRDPDSLGAIRTINVLTNCTAILDKLRWIHLPAAKGGYSPQDGTSCLPSLVVWVIGGKLRTETQALVPPLITVDDAETTTSRMIESFLKAIGDPKGATALRGATAVASDGFRTNTEPEKTIKREMIDSARTVIFLVDHSKFLEDGKYVFLGFRDAQELIQPGGKRIIVLTDRRPPLAITESLGKAGIELKVVAGGYQETKARAFGETR